MAKLLVVEDDPVIGLLYEEFLGASHQVTLAATYNDAVAALDAQYDNNSPGFDLLVSDLNLSARLPDGNFKGEGLDVAAHALCVNKKTDNKETGVLFVSGNISQLIDDARYRQHYAYMGKPVTVDTLLNKINQLLMRLAA